MNRRWSCAFVCCWLSAGAVSAGLVAPRVVARPAQGQVTSPPVWQPDIHAAPTYARHRRGVIAFAVRTDRGHWGYRSSRTFPSASVVKAMLLVAYLDHSSVRGRALQYRDFVLLGPMIRRSDDRAAQRVFRVVGRSGLRHLARRVGMHRFQARS